jgi:hypothetical protein
MELRGLAIVCFRLSRRFMRISMRFASIPVGGSSIVRKPIDADEPVPRYQHSRLQLYRNGLGKISESKQGIFRNRNSTKFRFSWPKIGAIMREVVSAVDVLTVSISTIAKAQALSDRYRYSYYDSLILASAIEARCEILYSEDFQHNQLIEGVRIINPFL